MGSRVKDIQETSDIMERMPILINPVWSIVGNSGSKRRAYILASSFTSAHSKEIVR